MLVFTLHLKLDVKLTTLNKISRNLFVKQAKSGSQQMAEGKNHKNERSHSKRWSKSSICKIGNHFWETTQYVYTNFSIHKCTCIMLLENKKYFVDAYRCPYTIQKLVL